MLRNGTAQVIEKTNHAEEWTAQVIQKTNHAEQWYSTSNSKD